MQTLGLTSHQYIIALMLFLVAYSLFEAPSNLSLKILSPKRLVQLPSRPRSRRTDSCIDGLVFSSSPSEHSAWA